MRLYKKSLLALLCAVSAVSYAADATPSAPNAAPTKPSKKRKKCDCASQNEAAARKALVSKGLDPNSAQGQVILRFAQKLADDPKLSKRVLDSGENGPSRWGAKLSPEERLRFLQLMKASVTATPGDCKAFLDSQKEQVDAAQYLPQLSPQALQSAIDMTEIAIRHEASDDDTSDGGSITERFEAHKFLLSGLEASLSDKASPPLDQCERIGLLVDHVSSAAEPMQSRASLALLHILEYQPSAPRQVLRQPETYLNEAFDERVLPESIRRALPPDGSHPLPFKRAVFDVEWVNKAEPASSQRLTGTIINRRNNGVVASIFAPVTPNKEADWTIFSLAYGTARLRSHLVDPAITASQTNLLDAAALVAANGPFREGATLHIPMPQPDARGEKERKCTVGRERPASTVFDKLTGSAIDLHCKQTSSEGVVTQLHDVWLTDYHLDMGLSAENQYGKIETVIHGVTVE
ncbi:hypothetical protein ACS7SF_21775 (plasmid) [Ralstonia sp. 25C]|uniref:hypothetical protein n=1 Tax=Ralstonia sp. 25C TaxID=3447363 RepID=UPI003F74EAD7